MITWQPIDTAPRDGTGLLLFVPDVERYRDLASNVIIGWFDGFRWRSDIREESEDYAMDKDGDEYCVPAWSAVDFRPVYWMPIPPEPAAPPVRE